jgi:hypothetical protein
MSLHINRFIDLIKSHESRAQKDFTMTMREAKDLHADITKLLLILEATRVQKNSNNEVIKVEMAGGKF